MAHLPCQTHPICLRSLDAKVQAGRVVLDVNALWHNSLERIAQFLPRWTGGSPKHS